MSEHDFVSLNIQLGMGNRLTLSAANVTSINKFLNDLNEVDEMDPEGVSVIDDMLTHVQTINAAVLVKFPAVSGGAGPVGNSAPAASTSTGESCKHGSMTYREGTVKSGVNTGKEYKGWFCPGPRGADQCKPKFINE